MHIMTSTCQIYLITVIFLSFTVATQRSEGIKQSCRYPSVCPFSLSHVPMSKRASQSYDYHRTLIGSRMLEVEPFGHRGLWPPEVAETSVWPNFVFHYIYTLSASLGTVNCRSRGRTVSSPSGTIQLVFFRLVLVTGYSSSQHASPLLELTCRMGSHSVNTCHPA